MFKRFVWVLDGHVLPGRFWRGLLSEPFFCTAWRQRMTIGVGGAWDSAGGNGVLVFISWWRGAVLLAPRLVW